MSTKVSTGKGGHTSVPTPPQRASFVLGSRPSQLRSPPVPRIKPGAASTSNYGKMPNQSNAAGVSAGNTGQTGLS